MTPPSPAPQRTYSPATSRTDVEVVEHVLVALDQGVTSALEADEVLATALLEALTLAYVAVWRHDDGVLRPVVAEGELVRALAASPQDGGAADAVARAGHVVLTHDGLLAGSVGDGAGAVSAQARWELARSNGAVQGALVPVPVDDGSPLVLELYARQPLPDLGGSAWRAAVRLVGVGRRQALTAHGLREAHDDREAVSTVVSQVGDAPDADAALRVALSTVRSAFGWQYGSFWRLDETDRVLRFEVESGSAGEEFRRATLAASFAEGVGLSGRAWRRRDLVFVPDLAEVTDCVRAPAARRAGVKSGVCFPVLDGSQVIGTMDFFVTRTIELPESRAAALRSVQRLVSERLTVLRQAEQEKHKSRQLLQTVDHLRSAADDAGRVAEEAAEQAASMTSEVAALDAASAAIGDVIKLISGIAGQTNLLALNATIEAARAGEVGRGFAVVAQEVKDLARATATATKQVAHQVAGLQASSSQVSSGILRTGEVIGRLGTVQRLMNDVLEEQVRMASTLSTARR